MLDIIIGTCLEYNALGKYSKNISGKEELWYNSKIDITFGDTTTWLIGLGRITNVCGPDVKIIADWGFFFDLIPAPHFAYKISQAVLMGTGGSTDVIFGTKDLINYGHTQDTNIIRKNTAPLEIKYFNDKNKPEWLFPGQLVGLIVFPYLALLTLVVTSRFAYMQVGQFSTMDSRDTLRGALNTYAPMVESRWIACLKVYETFNFTAYNLKKAVDNLTEMNNKVPEKSKDHAEKLSLLAQNVLITSTLKNEMEYQKKIIEEYLKGNLKDFKVIKTAAEDAIKVSADYLGEISQEITQSNIGLHASFKSLIYNTEEKIKLVVKKDDKSTSSIELTPRKFNIESAGVTFQIGSIAGTNGNFHFSSSEPKAFISLGFDDNISSMTILKENILIRSGKSPEKTPTIELEEGKLKLRCGSAISNPEIVIENDKVTIKVGAAEASGSSFVMTDDSIELKVGNNSALKISRDSIDIGHGESSTKWNNAGVILSVAESKMMIALAKIVEMSSTMKKTIDGVQSAQKTLSKDHGDAILELKAAVLKFN